MATKEEKLPETVRVRLLRDYWPVDRSMLGKGKDRLHAGEHHELPHDEAHAAVEKAAAELA